MSKYPNKCQCDPTDQTIHCPLLRRVDDPPEGRPMHPVRQQECREKPHYFEMFLSESLAGGNTTPRSRRSRRGLGDWLESLFRRLGIEEKPGCGCKKRKERINRIWFRGVNIIKMIFGQ